MRYLLAFVMSFTASPSAAQWVEPTRPPVLPAPMPWNPTAEYVEAGQDEPGYRVWIARQPWRAGFVSSFHRYLESSGVAWVAPTWQLLRTASDWRRCGAEPFEVPPAEEWANIVNTLRYVRDHVVPLVGPVEPVSVFRNAALNRCAGGALESVHQSMSAIDFVPLRPIDREQLIRRLCTEHQARGPRYNVGLGFYTKMRFHVDSWRYRTWGRDDHGDTACPTVAREPIVIAKAPTSQGGLAPSGSTPQPVVTQPVVTQPVANPPVAAAPVAAVGPGFSAPIGAAPTEIAGPPAPARPERASTPTRDPLAPL